MSVIIKLVYNNNRTHIPPVPRPIVYQSECKSGPTTYHLRWLKKTSILFSDFDTVLYTDLSAKFSVFLCAQIKYAFGIWPTWYFMICVDVPKERGKASEKISVMVSGRCRCRLVLLKYLKLLPCFEHKFHGWIWFAKKKVKILMLTSVLILFVCAMKWRYF